MQRPLMVSHNYCWLEETNQIQHRGVPANPPLANPPRPAEDFEVKVDVYEDRVWTWGLEIATKLVADGDDTPGDYAGFALALSQLEAAQQYREGQETPKGSSGTLFKRSGHRIFGLPEQSPELSRLWGGARNGLFHSAFTKDKVYLSHDYEKVLAMSGNRLKVNPGKFVDLVVKDFRTYVAELRAKPAGQLAENFVKLWDYFWSKS